MASADPLRILLVEDDEDDVVLTRDLLEEIGPDWFTLDWVGTVDEAVRACLEGRHDVYLLDYRLDSTDGIQLLRRAAEAGCNGPFILLTGQADRRIDVEAMEAGAMDYLIKGAIDARLLERSIRYAVARKKVEDELAEVHARVAESRETERLVLARELHDGPLQDLYGVRFQLSAIAESLEGEAAEALTGPVQGALRQVIDQLRAICHDLRPPALAPFGLEVAIRSHAERFQAAHPELDLELDLDADGQALAERTRLALYRIYQQALANIAKHAQARHAVVRLRVDERVRLEIRDDGRGFQVPAHWLALARAGHLGLVGATERAEAIGGRLEVVSAPGEGTLVRVTAPPGPPADGPGEPSTPAQPDGHP